MLIKGKFPTPIELTKEYERVLQEIEEYDKQRETAESEMYSNSDEYSRFYDLDKILTSLHTQKSILEFQAQLCSYSATSLWTL